MKRNDRDPRQLPLMPAADFVPTADPVGAALGAIGADPEAQWDLVMELYARSAKRAYYRAHAKPESAE